MQINLRINDPALPYMISSPHLTNPPPTNWFISFCIRLQNSGSPTAALFINSFVYFKMYLQLLPTLPHCAGFHPS